MRHCGISSASWFGLKDQLHWYEGWLVDERVLWKSYRYQTKKSLYKIQKAMKCKKLKKIQNTEKKKN